MAANSVPSEVAKRRIFCKGEGSAFQIFSIEQNRNDFSLYLSSPSFKDIEWVSPASNSRAEMVLARFRSDGDGKLSVHGKGVVHVRKHQATVDTGISVPGSPLVEFDKRSFGARHLITILLSEPAYLPNSPAKTRLSDYVIETKVLKPIVLILFAIPRIENITVEINYGFRTEDLESIPPEGGWGAFDLLGHSVLWLAYRTKHMNHWPRGPIASYYDGHAVPFFIGTESGKCRMEMRRPTYSLNGNKFLIDMKSE